VAAGAARAAKNIKGVAKMILVSTILTSGLPIPSLHSILVCNAPKLHSSEVRRLISTVCVYTALIERFLCNKLEPLLAELQMSPVGRSETEFRVA